jgi:hypothetical protein
MDKTHQHEQPANNRLTIEKLNELINAVENPKHLLTHDGLIPLRVPFEDMTPEQQRACIKLEERVGAKMSEIKRKLMRATPPC